MFVKGAIQPMTQFLFIYYYFNDASSISKCL